MTIIHDTREDGGHGSENVVTVTVLDDGYLSIRITETVLDSTFTISAELTPAQADALGYALRCQDPGQDIATVVDTAPASAPVKAAPVKAAPAKKAAAKKATK